MDYELKPISVVKMQKLQASVEKRFKAQGKILEPPTYITKLPNGAEQKHEYDLEAIEDPSTSEEDKALWEQYQKDLAEFNVELSNASMNMILYDGVKCEVNEEWIEEQRWMGIDIPDNKFDLKVHYLQTEVFMTPIDIQKVIQDVMLLSMKGVDQDAVDAAMRSFRGESEDGEEQDN